MPKKRAPKNGRFPEERAFEEKMARLLAGCPFTDFGPCKAERCAFYVMAGPTPTDRECCIREIFCDTRLLMLLLSGRMVDMSARSESKIVAVRIVECVVDSLRSLDGLLAHPQTDPAIKLKISEVKQCVRDALKTFAEPL